MKILASTLVASALLLGSQIAMAQPDRHDHDHDHDPHGPSHDRGHHDDHHHDRGHDDHGHYHGHPQAHYIPSGHHWERGRRYDGPTYVVTDYRSHRLRPPPPGYRWVRDSSDFLLVAAATGIILDIAAH